MILTRDCFSLQFDESTDAVDVAQLCVFVRMVFDDMSLKEELLTILPLKGNTRGTDIFQVFMEFANKTQLPLFKLAPLQPMGLQRWLDALLGSLDCANSVNPSRIS